MRALLQRVSHVQLSIENKLYSSIEHGLLVLLGIEEEDSQEDIDWLVQKISKLRIFNDPQGKMNLSVKDINGEILLISQFTLFASTKKGNRPSFMNSAQPKIAIPLYEKFIKLLNTSIITKTGTFGADMKVTLINDGPVTISVDSKHRE